MNRPTEPLLLAEYETSPPLRLGPEDLSLLASLPSDRIGVVATGDSGLVQLRATQWVGGVRLPSRIVRVVPKVDDLRNVLMMMSAAAGLTDWSSDPIGYAVDDLVEGVAELVLRSIDSATRRGLVHGYREQEDRLHTIRGRLLVNELARRPWERAPVPCRYDHFSPDIRENRVLRATVEEVATWPLAPGVRRHARSLQSRLEAATPSIRPLDDFDAVVASPVNEHYLPALRLCRLVFEGASALHAPGSLQADAFLIDMNELYEAWIGEELARRMPPSIEVVEQVPVPLSQKPFVGMKPDLLLRRDGRAVYVADVKYKLTGTGISRTSDYYQLLAYTTALDLPAGTLIYCQAAEAAPKDITVLFGGQRLRCHPVGLSGTWVDVSSRLDALATELAKESENSQCELGAD